MIVCTEPIVAGDRRAAGQRAAARAIAAMSLGQLGYDGVRPIVVGDPGVAVSITHGRFVAIAAAARATRLGIDLVDDVDDPRLARVAPRYLPFKAPDQRAACFAAMEAGLKALGLGLLDGGVFDDTPAVTVVSLDPPRLDDPRLALELRPVGRGVLAIVVQDESLR